MVDFTTYVPPGVYIEDTTTPLVSTTGVLASVVAIIGPTLGYQVFTETVVLTGTNQTVLLKKGINVGTISVRKGNTPLVEDDDYEVDQGSAGTGEEVEYSLSRVGDSTLLTGPGPWTIVVSYQYTDALYYEPRTFEDYDDLVDVYGQPLIASPTSSYIGSSSQVDSPLSFAAKIAFENGANRVVAIPTDARGTSTPSYAAQLVAAYGKIATVYETNVIVPLLVGIDSTATVQNIAEALADYCVESAIEGFPRVGILGLTANFKENGVGGAGAQDFIDLAVGVKNKRVVLAYPEALNYYNPQTNQTAVLDGIYLAAAYAGRMVATPVQKPLTKEQIRSFAGLPTIISRKQTRSFKDSLSKNGIAVAEVDRNNRLIVRHGVSTDPTSLLTREVSITRARDLLYVLLQAGVEAAGLIGTPIDVETPSTVKGVVAGILENCVSNDTIVAYDNLKVRQQVLPTGDPSVIEVKFEYRPAIPLNYIVVSFAINVETGEVAVDGGITLPDIPPIDAT